MSTSNTVLGLVARRVTIIFVIAVTIALIFVIATVAHVSLALWNRPRAIV